jgi:catechol 2,3-dioxygenase-like lactoylglutathione lyase family enzyme
MGLRGIDRIVIAVHDLEKSKQKYSELLGATFMAADWTGEPFGINVAISWDAGIELCAPMPGREEDSAVSPFLAHRGEGILTVCFGVDDADSAHERASGLGYGCVNSLDYTQEEIDQHLEGLFSRYHEFFLDTHSSCGFGVALVRIDPKQQP